jgi:ATP-dependent RNA helicase SUPV3L1/SUV3
MLERLADAIRPKIAARAELGHGYGGAGFVADADLMSLVGCSGEAFDGLLASLGFKPQTIRVKKMPEAKPVEDAAPAADAPAEAAPDASREATPQPAPDAGEATPQEATEAPAAEETVTTETDPTAKPTTAENAVSETEISATDAAEVASETGAADDANADDDGMEEIVLWRPVRKNRGPQGPRSRAADGESNARTGGGGKPGGPARGKGPRKGGKKGGPNAGGKGGNKGPRQMSARPPRSDKPVDPDSPFAVLSQLKNKS